MDRVSVGECLPMVYIPAMNQTVDTELKTRPGLLSLLLRVWALTMICLIVSSWKLWTGTSLFPAVPLFSFLIDAPLLMDWIALAGLLIGLAGILVFGRTSTEGRATTASRTSLAIFLISAVFAVLLNQHRLQPWMWQGLLISTLFLVTRPGGKATAGLLTLLRGLMVAIYFYSAISKFDYQFLETVGTDLFAGSAQLSGGFVQIDPDSSIARFVVGLFPLVELVIGILLIFVRTRRTAAVAGSIMHCALIGILGPWGLNHCLPVLIWNLFFVAMLLILFWRCNDPVPVTRAVRKLNLIPFTMLIFLFLFPATSWIGGADHWSSWKLYSPGNSRVFPVFRTGDAESWPTAVTGNQVVKPEMAGFLSKVDINGWSLQELGVPVYPEDRFQAGVGAAIIQSGPRDGYMMLEWQSESNSWTGQRETRLFYSSSEKTDEHPDRLHEKFLFNSRPRSAIGISR